MIDKGLPYEDPEYSLYGFNFVKSVIRVAFGIPLALFIMLMLVDLFSEEKSNHSEKLRLIQPVKRTNILLSKIVASYIYVIVFLVLTCVLSYILSVLFGSGFGSIHYPLESQIGLESTGVIMGEYVFLSVLYYSLYLLFIISCIALFAAIIKETSLIVVLGILMMIVTNGILGGNLNYINPF